MKFYAKFIIASFAALAFLPESEQRHHHPESNHTCGEVRMRGTDSRLIINHDIQEELGVNEDEVNEPFANNTAAMKMFVRGVCSVINSHRSPPEDRGFSTAAVAIPWSLLIIVLVATTGFFVTAYIKERRAQRGFQPMGSTSHDDV